MRYTVSLTVQVGVIAGSAKEAERYAKGFVESGIHHLCAEGFTLVDYNENTGIDYDENFDPRVSVEVGRMV